MLLSALCLFPLIGSIALALFPKGRERAMRLWALFVSLLVLGGAVLLALRFDHSATGFQFQERYAWSRSYGIDFSLGVDGLSIWLVCLTALLLPLCLLLSVKSVQTQVRAFLISFLVLEAGLLGVFMSLDLFLFYIFWELVLIPMYFIIGLWGHKDRLYATTKFVLYTLAGSLLMLVGILGMVASTARELGVLTFDLTKFYELGHSSPWQGWIFLCLFVGFAIKIPIFPFHTWLPDAHVQAPAAGSVMLAGVLLKMGVYGFLRIALPILPQASLAWASWILVLGLIGIVYGSLVALAQDDAKRLVAYSSVAHLGFCVVGIFSLTSEGMSGGVLQMINHGLSTGALFLLLGMLYERTHSHKISDFGGLAANMPRFAALFGIVTFSSMGLPGLNNFVGEFLSIFGLFQVSQIGAMVALLGVILAAWYMLRLFRKIFFGPIAGLSVGCHDLSVREWVILTPLIAAIFWIGLYPEPVLSGIRPAVDRLVSTVHNGSSLGDISQRIIQGDEIR